MATFDPTGFFFGELAGLRDDDRNARSAADARQANERSTERQMEFQHNEASTAREFAERMSNTSHQREIADLAKAGLNPILAAKHGGSSTPTVGAPSGASSSAPLQAPSQSGIGAATTAMAWRRNEEEVKNLKTSNDFIRAQTDQAKSAAALNSVLYNRGLAETNTEKERTRDMFHQANITGMDEKGRHLESQIDQTKYGEVIRYINRALGAVNSAGSLRQRFNQR